MLVRDLMEILKKAPQDKQVEIGASHLVISVICGRGVL